MQTALLAFVVLASVLVAAGSILAWFAVRRAPQGVENEDGFQSVQPMATIVPFPTVLEREEMKKRAA